MSAFLDPQALPVCRLLSRDVDRVTYALEVPRELTWFEGHYPDAPILPGLAQVCWATELAAREFEVRAPVAEIRRLKFSRPIFPDDPVQLLLERLDEGRIAFRYHGPPANYSAGTLQFDEAMLDRAGLQP